MLDKLYPDFNAQEPEESEEEIIMVELPDGTVVPMKWAFPRLVVG